MAPHSQNSESTRGLWAQTASIDWCESNYELSYYVAEFWNTLSNLAFFLPQIIQYLALTKQPNIEPAFRRAYLSLALVGIGSACFHMTLSRPMQMFDETSMILVSLHTFYLLYIIRYPKVDRRKLTTFVVAYGINFLCLYLFLVHWPIFHHTAFGILVYASIMLGYQLKLLYGSHYKFWSVVILQHTGFLFWLIDKHYCEMLTQFRDHHVPSFLKPILQFHALWHLFMGFSTQIYICGLIRLRMWIKFREEYVIHYGWFGLYIHLEKVDEANSPLATMEKEQQKLRGKQQQRQNRDNVVGNHSHTDSELKYRYKNGPDLWLDDDDYHHQENDHEIDLNQNEVHSQH